MAFVLEVVPIKRSQSIFRIVYGVTTQNKHQIRIPENEIPNDYIRGRILENNPGIDKANASDGCCRYNRAKSNKKLP